MARDRLHQSGPAARRGGHSSARRFFGKIGGAWRDRIRAINCQRDSNGSYGIEKGLICSFPTRSDGARVEIVQDVPLNDFAKAKVEATVNELKEERAMVAELLPG